MVGCGSGGTSPSQSRIGLRWDECSCRTAGNDRLRWNFALPVPNWFAWGECFCGTAGSNAAQGELCVPSPELVCGGMSASAEPQETTGSGGTSPSQFRIGLRGVSAPVESREATRLRWNFALPVPSCFAGGRVLLPSRRKLRAKSILRRNYRGVDWLSSQTNNPFARCMRFSA